MERFDDQALARGPALVWVRYDVADQPLTVILVSAVGRSVKKKPHSIEFSGSPLDFRC